MGVAAKTKVGPFEHPEWDQGSIWAAIKSDDDWTLAYRPYDDEPVRLSASPLVSESSLDGLEMIALESIARARN